MDKDRLLSEWERDASGRPAKVEYEWEWEWGEGAVRVREGERATETRRDEDEDEDEDDTRVLARRAIVLQRVRVRYDTDYNRIPKRATDAGAEPEPER